MDNDQATAILRSKIEVTASIADHLAYSINKAQQLELDPIAMDKLKTISDDEMETVAAFLFRYGSLVSNIQDAIFKSIGDVEQEPIKEMSNRDKTNLMERIGVLPSAEEFSSLAIIRNKLMHDYPEEMQKHLDRINTIIKDAPRLVEIFIGIAKYAEKFSIKMSFDGLKHLRGFIRDDNANDAPNSFSSPSSRLLG